MEMYFSVPHIEYILTVLQYELKYSQNAQNTLNIIN